MIHCVDCSCELPDARTNTKRCGPCKLALKRAAGREWYRANRDAVLVRARAAARANPERGRAAMKAWRERNPEKARAASLRHKRRQYGVENPSGEVKVGACHNGQCTYVGPLQLDHDHRTGRFRGWLCRRCNLALGALEDSGAVARGLADYADLHNEVGWPLDTGQSEG